MDQQEEDTYIPRGLNTKDGILFDAAIDNFDKNEDTVYCKTTTHSMAIVLYKRSHVPLSDSSGLPRTTKKAATVDAQDEILHRYDKMSYVMLSSVM